MITLDYIFWWEGAVMSSIGGGLMLLWLLAWLVEQLLNYSELGRYLIWFAGDKIGRAEAIKKAKEHPGQQTPNLRV